MATRGHNITNLQYSIMASQHVAFQRFFLLLLIAISFANAIDVEELQEQPQSKECLESAHNLVAFVEREGGSFSKLQELKLTADYGIGPQTASSGAKIGVYAKETIEEGTVLSRVPWSVILDDQDTPSYYEEKQRERASLKEHAVLDEDVIAANEAYIAALPNMACPTFRNLLREVLLDEGSRMYPYFGYLYNARRNLPAYYSDRAKKMLEQLFKRPMEEQLPLLDDLKNSFLLNHHFDLCDKLPTHKHTGAFIEREAVAKLVVQFAHNGLLIPTYDFYGHRNGKYHNTKTVIQKGEYVEIVASRTIEAGEGIYGSYSDCSDCDPLLKHYGVAGKLSLQAT